jgi:hypothetical protein
MFQPLNKFIELTFRNGRSNLRRFIRFRNSRNNRSILIQCLNIVPFFGIGIRSLALGTPGVQ